MIHRNNILSLAEIFGVHKSFKVAHYEYQSYLHLSGFLALQVPHSAAGFEQHLPWNSYPVEYCLWQAVYHLVLMFQFC